MLQCFWIFDWEIKEIWFEMISVHLWRILSYKFLKNKHQEIFIEIMDTKKLNQSHLLKRPFFLSRLAYKWDSRAYMIGFKEEEEFIKKMMKFITRKIHLL